MRTLRFVGPGRDHDRLLLEAEDGSEQFELTVTPELRAAARTDLPRLTPLSAPLVENRLRPRDIQTRVRAGESPQELADEAGLPVESILRFAAPVMDERSRVASEARRARARRNGADGPPVVFGETVDSRFAAHGIDPETVRWDSARREDGQWVVSARWIGGDAERRADWAFTMSARSVAPLDDAAADLLSDRPVRPLAAPMPVPALPADPEPAEPSPFHGAFEDPAAPVPPRPMPFVPHLVPDTAPAAAPAAQARPLYDEPVHPRRRVDIDDMAAALDTDVMPSLPLGIDAPPAVLIPRGRRDESEEERAARARIPSWDDILLGVRRKRD